MHHKKQAQEALIKWLPLAVVIIIFAGLIEVAVQQNYRMNANDPQIQVAEDVSTAITKGQAAADSIVSPAPTADMTASLSTFLLIYNATGTPMGGSVQLDGKVPTPPTAVFDLVKTRGQQRFTWQPKAGVRIAAVISQYTGASSGFVLVGRSLREVEIRETDLLKMTGAATFLALLLSYLLVLYFIKFSFAGHVHHVAAEIEAAAPEYHHEHHHS